MTDQEYLELERRFYEKRKKTRNERKRNRWRTAYFITLIFWAVIVVWILVFDVQTSAKEPEIIIEYVYVETDLENEDSEATGYASLEALFYDKANKITDCKITHYCTELHPHICGTGDGLTSTGVPVTAGWSCAVDPSVIPYGSQIMVDYGDRVEFYEAQDCGGAIIGNHIDLAVLSHDEALEKGVKYAAVYWLEDNTY